MAWMKQVKRTKPFSVSSLTASAPCYLRAVQDAERAPRQIGASPLARLGIVLHQVLESRSPESRLRETLKEILQGGHEVQSIAAPAGAHSIPLNHAIETSRILRRARPIRRRIRSLPPRETRAVGTEPGGHRTANRFVEEKLESGDGELQGRVDLLTVDSERRLATVVDFKSGGIFSHDDKELRPGYRRQVEAYALMVRERFSSARIEGRVEGEDGVWQEELSTADIDRSRDRLRAAVNQAPRGVERGADELAAPGEVCQFCPYRPTCRGYVRRAPDWWKVAKPDFAAPADIWGTVTKIEGDDPGIRLGLQDAAGRSVSIFGVPTEEARSLKSGDSLGLFALKPIGRTQGHPRNFRVASARLSESAHQAIVVKGFSSAPV